MNNINSYSKINSDFIKEIRSKTKTKPLRILQSILSLNKEAIYRRLRGDVPFSYIEATLIAQKLGISLDQINQINLDSHTFKLDKIPTLFSEEGYFNSFITPLVSQKSIWTKDTSAYLVKSTIPLVFMGNYPYLAKLRYYKWLYENIGIGIFKQKFSDLTISSKHESAYQDFITMLQRVDTHFILSDLAIENYVKEVKHFSDIGAIEKKDLKPIKKELLNTISHFESVLSSGYFQDAGKVVVYLSEVDMGVSFGYMHAGASKIAINRMFGMNYAVSTSHELINMYERSFENLTNYTTLISRMASRERMTFLNKQRDLIERSL